MTEEPPKIFISYSRKDKEWLERLQVHLKPLESDGVVDLWDDTEIKAGADWEAEIERALVEAKAAILLISADFLASDFIRKRELQPLLEAAKDDGLLILSVILSPSRFKRMKHLSKFQVVNDPDRPLISLERWEQEQIFLDVAEAVEDALSSVGDPAAQPARSRSSSPHPERARTPTPETWQKDWGMAFAPIPAGTFEMGSSTKDAHEREQPVHTVTISEPFYLGVHVVTQGPWKAVMDSEPWKGESYVEEGDDYPAVYVSWDEAQAFIEKLNARDDESIYRLPTEAEWEYACRAESTTEYYFGNGMRKLKAYAWYKKNASEVGEKYAHRVGQKRANEWGLY
ncbi:MAG: SUMF1/EgtB/PvdO family nonheme iron enzyme, partial [Bacteroidetes bacterium]|nr:SUMF1/EgtB/PvdO family nonheme iron enzyme [Bacteroidota bacterium]